MASSSSNVSLAIFYDGTNKYKNWSITTIDIKLEGTKDYISASVTDALVEASVYIKKYLPFSTNKDYRTTISDTIDVPLSAVKTLKLSAKIFQTYENPYFQTQQPDGTLKAELRCKGDNLPVFFSSDTDFKGGESYLITIQNAHGTLKATFENIAADVLRTQITAAKQEAAQKDLGLRMMQAGIDSLNFAFTHIPEGSQMLAGLQDIQNAFKRGVQGVGEPTLDSLPVEELQKRYRAKLAEHKDNRQNFEIALLSEDQFTIQSALNKKQSSARALLELENALHRKGCPVEANQPQECNIQ